jgi:hypothetical protein
MSRTRRHHRLRRCRLGRSRRGRPTAPRLALAARATVVREVPVDQSLTYDDVELDDGSTILQVRRLQDLLLRMARQPYARRSRDPEVLRTLMGLPVPTASP